MRWTLLLAGTAMAVAAIASSWFRPPPTTRPIPPHEVAKLAALADEARRERLEDLVERARKGPRIPEVLLVQIVEHGKVIVVDLPGDDVSDDEPATGWEIPWEPAADAIRDEPEVKRTVHSHRGGIRYRHEVYPVSTKDGLFLLVNSGAPPTSWAGWRFAVLGFAAILLMAGFRHGGSM